MLLGEELLNYQPCFSSHWLILVSGFNFLRTGWYLQDGILAVYISWLWCHTWCPLPRQRTRPQAKRRWRQELHIAGGPSTCPSGARVERGTPMARTRTAGVTNRKALVLLQTGVHLGSWAAGMTYTGISVAGNLRFSSLVAVCVCSCFILLWLAVILIGVCSRNTQVYELTMCEVHSTSPQISNSVPRRKREWVSKTVLFGGGWMLFWPRKSPQ